MPTPPKEAGASLAAQHVGELEDSIEEYGGNEAPSAVQFMVAYMQKMKELQEAKVA